MDPVNGPLAVAAVESRLPPAAFARAHQRGLLLDRAAVRAYIDAL